MNILKAFHSCVKVKINQIRFDDSILFIKNDFDFPQIDVLDLSDSVYFYLSLETHMSLGESWA